MAMSLIELNRNQLSFSACTNASLVTAKKSNWRSVIDLSHLYSNAASARDA
jgi:hypothetical protein